MIQFGKILLKDPGPLDSFQKFKYIEVISGEKMAFRESYSGQNTSKLRMKESKMYIFHQSMG